MSKAKLSLALLIFVLGYSFFPIRVSAHVLQYDGSIGAVLHIDPEDDPIAQQQAAFFFEFKDKQGKFKPENCNCTFSILENGKTIYAQPLFQNNPNPSLDNASVFFTFPQRDVYQVQVAGTPLAPDAFQSFTLTYNVRVARIAAAGATQSSGLNMQPYVIIGATAILCVIFIFIMKRRSK